MAAKGIPKKDGSGKGVSANEGRGGCTDTKGKGCVAQWISELHNAHPDWEDKQIIAVAYEKCGVSKNDFEEGFCPYDILTRITFTESFSDHLYSDFTGLPTSVMVANAVDFALPRLKQELPDLDEIELLKTAYGLAQEVLKNSDFETYSEKPIYFAISIPNSELEAFELELRRAAYYSDEGEIDFTNDNLFKIYTDDKAEPFFKPETSVSSSNVAEVGYDAGKLRIFFKNGGGYEYPVPQTFYMEMMSAPSKGSFVWNYLRGKAPGRVIDNPNKTTPGGVGGSIVPYFKIKNNRMSQKAQARSVQTFLKAARSGNAKVGTTPIQQIDRPTFKAFQRFTSTYQTSLFQKLKMRQIGRFVKKLPQPGQKPATPQTQKPSSKIPKATTKKPKKVSIKRTKKKKDKTEEIQRKSDADSRALIRAQIRRLRKQLKQARQNKLESKVKSLEKKIETLEKRLETVGDFTDDFIHYSHLTDDFTNDMHYFRGPITRAGKFQYGNEVKTKDLDNLREVAAKYRHLPSFDSHQENEILGFAYNFTDDPDLFMKDHPKYSELVGKPYIFSEGYAFKDIENQTDIDIKADETLLPTSMRFLDSNEGFDSTEQHLTALVHLAISTDQSDRDRCSTLGGDPCWVSFHDKQAKPKLIGDFMPKDKKEEEDEESGSDGDEEEEDADSKDEQKKEDDDFVPRKAYDAILKDVADLIKTVDDFSIIEKKRDARDQAREKEMDKIKLDTIRSDFTKENQLYTIKSDFLKEADLLGLTVLKNALVPHTPKVDGHSQLFNEDFSSNKYQKDLADVKKRYSKSYGIGE